MERVGPELIYLGVAGDLHHTYTKVGLVKETPPWPSFSYFNFRCGPLIDMAY